MARVDRLTVTTTLLADGLVPLFYHGDAETVRRVIGAVARGGARCLEFTNRGDGAVELPEAVISDQLLAGSRQLSAWAGSRGRGTIGLGGGPQRLAIGSL
jgi:hypothetical protein